MTALEGPTFDVEHLHRLFTRMYAEHKLPITNYLGKMFQSRALAEELAQETFLKAWEALPRFRPENESGWLYRIAYRVGIDHYRWRTLRRGPDWESVLAASPTPAALVAPDDPEGDALAAERRRLVAATLARLPVQYARILVLFEYEAWSYRDLCARLGLSRATVKCRLFRARAAFAAQWPRVSGEPLPARLPRRGSRATGRGVFYRGGRGSRSDRSAPPPRPWVVTPYDPVRRKQVWVGSYATEEEARAALDAWRAQQATEGAAA